MTTPKTILVQFANPSRLKAMLAGAITIARPFEAHVVGLYVIPPVVVVGAGMPGAPATVVIDDYRKEFQRNAAAMRKEFDAILAASGCLGEWRTVDAEHDQVSRALTSHIRSTDLGIVSQTDPQWQFTEFADYPEIAAMESGRPVLILPNAPTVDTIGRRVVIAWNGRREAARAAFDAVPLLRKAEAVRVVWANADDESDVAGELPAADLCEALSRHGVRCEGTATASGSRSAGEVLLAESERYQADLLVMGCYGHSRVREFLLGGATRHVLAKMRLPVLMSH